MTTEFKRLGKRGSYRLGRLRAQGIGVAGPPARFRPSFARDVRRGPASAWLLALLAGALAVWGGAVGGWWYLPFAAGVAAGLANRVGGWRTRVAVPAVAAMAVAGWGIALLWQVAYEHLPYGGVARVIAALCGLPGNAAVGFAVTLLIAGVQAVVGYWLGRAVTPRPAND